jgi:hypothetical protein
VIQCRSEARAARRRRTPAWSRANDAGPRIGHAPGAPPATPPVGARLVGTGSARAAPGDQHQRRPRGM